MNIDKPYIKFDGKKFKIYVPDGFDRSEIKVIFKEWYKLKALKCIKNRVNHYCKITGLDYNRLTIREQKTRWGSCSQKRNLNFNWKIIMSPQWVIDYVVIHEVCHLEHLNHSKDFWNMVALYMPDYLRAKEWLKRNGLKLNF